VNIKIQVVNQGALGDKHCVFVDDRLVSYYRRLPDSDFWEVGLQEPQGERREYWSMICPSQESAKEQAIMWATTPESAFKRQNSWRDKQPPQN
jgi:hypothetical protein